jgi:hypothetical protein
MTAAASRYRRGDLVEVKGLEEILGTLDADGKLEGLPFMPEMARYCGQRLRIHRRAARTCVEGLGLRGMAGTVLLEGTRCDGSAHEGCQRVCLLFWKDAWLKPCDSAVSETPCGCVPRTEPRERSESPGPLRGPINDPAALPTRKGDRFCCQSTELPGATCDFPPGNLRHLFGDLFAGEATPAEIVRIFWWKVVNRLRRHFGRGLHKHIRGTEPKPAKGELHLVPGEWVEVKSAPEIAVLLDAEGKNHGLTFEKEMLEYCGGRYQVAFRIEKIILEESGKKAGKMVTLANTVALQGITCRGTCAKNCPRDNYLWWRESWLRRVAEQPLGGPPSPNRCRS